MTHRSALTVNRGWLGLLLALALVAMSAPAQALALPSATDGEAGAESTVRASGELRSASRELPAGTRADWADRYTSDLDGTIVTYVPVRGAEEGSTMGFVVAEGAVQSWFVLTAVEAPGGESADVRYVRDGEVLLDRTVTEQDVLETLGGFADCDHLDAQGADSGEIGIAVHSPGQGFWSCMNATLASLGLSSWAMVGISLVCAAACATLVGCAPCIAFATGFATGTVSAVVHHCW